jgi:hypothetical protein
MRQIKIYLFLYLLFMGLGHVLADNQPKKQYYPTRVIEAPYINGILDDHAWTTGTWESGFTQHEPHNGLAPSQHTEFCIMYDDIYLYVAMRAYDSEPDSIVSRMTRRDNSDGDFVGVAFDSYYDQRTAFIMGVTAGGTRFDFIMSNNGQNEDPTWDPNWLARTNINDWGWEAEMRIPLSQLRFKKNGTGTWGLEVFRMIHRHGEMSFWQHIPANSPGIVHLFGEMKGMDHIHPRQVFDISPYLVTSGETYQSQSGNPFLSGREGHLKAGLDAKIGITNNFTLDLTVNPDFGQVEADPSEVNLTAFETFFQEKRPFFIEGRNISSFSLGIGDGSLGNDNLFYSRRIGRRPVGQIQTNGDAWVDRPSFTNILGAAKLTGKTQQGLSLAVIQSVTGEANAKIDINGERSFKTLEPLTNYFVGRVQQDYNDGNMILGGIFTSTHRNLDENLNSQMHGQAYSGGIDFTKFFKDKTWMFNVNTAVSHVAGSEEAILRTQRSPARYFQRPDADHVKLDSARTSLTGSGGRVQILKTGSGHWSMLGSVIWKSPQFEINDLGFMREADNILQVVWVGYREWEPKGFYRSYNINMNQYNVWNFGGQQVMGGANINGFIRYKNFWSTNAGVEYNFSMLSTTMLRGGPALRMPDRVNTWFGSSTDFRKKLVLNVSGRYSFGLDENLRSISIGPGITYKPADNFNFSFNPSYMKSFDMLQYVSQVQYQGTTRYIFATIDQNVVNFSFRVNYTITPDLTIQYWGQPFVAAGKYNDFKFITNPRAQDFKDRFQPYNTNQLSIDENLYIVDDDLDGSIDYRFRNPDFSFREFLSNLVIRWEFNPGSSVYFVWNQTRSVNGNFGEMHYFNDLDQMFSVKPHNIFLIKFSYRLGVKG